MTAKQENRLSGAITTHNYLLSSQPIWGGIQLFVDRVAFYGNLIEEIKAARITQEKNISGIAEDKETAWEAMADKAVEIAMAIETFAIINGNSELQKLVHVSSSSFSKTDDTGKLSLAQNIYNLAVENFESIQTINTTQADIDDLKAKLETYNAIVQKPREAITETSEATEQLTGLFKELTRQNEILDRLVETFRTQQPEFVSRYKMARVIVD